MADDAECGGCSGGEIYQLRVVIAGISPLIWRRLLVTGETTIAQLHAPSRWHGPLTRPKAPACPVSGVCGRYA